MAVLVWVDCWATVDVEETLSLIVTKRDEDVVS